MKPAPTIRRDSDLATRVFPFELLHAREAATNMRAFHWHDFVELSLVRSGRGTYEIEDKTFRVGPGDVVIINDTERHRVTYRAFEPLHETVLHFAPGLLDDRYQRLFHYDGAAFANKPRLSPPARRAVRRLVGEIRSEWEARLPWHELAVRAKLLEIVALLLRECGVREPGTPAAAAARRRTIARLELVLAWMRAGFRRPIGLAEAARRFSLRPSYLSDFIRRNLGVTFTEFLAHLRVEEAARLLAEGRGSTEAAFASGFNTTAGFYAAFKRVMGVNPGEWLRRRGAPGGPASHQVRSKGA
jgi:AraC-like DNA-binding protein